MSASKDTSLPKSASGMKSLREPQSQCTVHAFVTATEDGEPEVYVVDFAKTESGQAVLDRLQELDPGGNGILFCMISEFIETGNWHCYKNSTELPSGVVPLDFRLHWAKYASWRMAIPMPEEPAIVHIVNIAWS